MIPMAYNGPMIPNKRRGCGKNTATRGLTTLLCALAINFVHLYTACNSKLHASRAEEAEQRPHLLFEVPKVHVCTQAKQLYNLQQHSEVW